MVELNKEAIAADLRKINKELKGAHPNLVANRKKLNSIPRSRLRLDLAAEYDRLKTEYDKKATQFVSTRTKEILKALDQFRSALQGSKLPNPDPVVQITLWMKDLRELDLAEDELRHWNTELKKLSSEREDLASVFDIIRQVEELWHQAKTTEDGNGSPEKILRDYREAVEIIKGNLDKRKITWPGPKRRLETLLVKAEKDDRDAHERFEFAPTRARGDEIVSQYKSFLNDKPDKKIMFPQSADLNATDVTMSIGEAIPIALNLIGRFWDEKVKKYTEEAAQCLKKHNLEGAEAFLRDCHRLPGLGDPQIELGLSYDSTILIGDLEKQIAEARQKQKNAEDLCDQAMRSLGNLDYGEAIRLAQAAEGVDTFVPKVKTLKSNIQAQMLAEAATHVQNAENRLSEGDLEYSGEATSEAVALLGTNPKTLAPCRYLRTADRPSALALGLNPDVSVPESRIRKVAETLGDIEKTTAFVEERIRSDPKGAQKILNEFVRKYGAPQVERWDLVQSLASRVEVSLNAKKTKEELEALIKRNQIKDLEAARAEYDSVQNDIPPEYQMDFQPLSPEIDARLAYLRAIEPRISPPEALRVLEPALVFAPLKAEATKLASELKKQIASNEQIAKTLKKAHAAIENDDPHEAYRQAIALAGQNEELDDLIERARETWEQKTTEEIERLFRNLTFENVKRIRNLLKQLSEMDSGKLRQYKQLCDLPCAEAEAQFLGDTEVKDKDWKVVADAWENAGELAEQYDQPKKAKDYLVKERQARKQQKVGAVRNARPEQKLGILSELNDEFQSQDSELLWWLGQAHLELGEQIVRGARVSQPANSQTAREHFDEAVRFFESALELSVSQNVDARIEESLSKARALREFEERKQDIFDRLQRTQLNVRDCQKAKDLYLSAKMDVARVGTNYVKLLTKWWEERVSATYEIIQNQAAKLPQDSDLFTKLRPWICILVLSERPDDEVEALRHVRMLNQVVSELEAKINKESTDFEAAAHEDIYGRFSRIDLGDEQKRNQVAPQMQAVLDKQIGFCEQLRSSLDDPERAVLFYANLRLPDSQSIEKCLTATKENLTRWLERLRSFRQRVSRVRALADASLRSGDFTVAWRELGAEGNPNPAFSGFDGHPTYIWLNDYMERLESQRSSQEKYRQMIEWCFPLEYVCTQKELDDSETEWQKDNQLASSGKTDKEQHRELVHELHIALTKGQYPREFLLGRMEAMRKNDPQDACALQGKLAYKDAVERASELHGLQEILPRFQTKVSQLIEAEDWLKKVAGVSPRDKWEDQMSSRREWAVEYRKNIEEERENGHLTKAKDMCNVLLSEEEHKVEEYVSLGFTKKHLGDLPESIGEPRPTDTLLLGLREKIDNLSDLVDQQISEFSKLLTNIEWRIKNRPDRQEAVLVARNNLWRELERPRGLGFLNNKVPERTEQLREAIQEYMQICPHDDWITNIIKETGVQVNV